MTSWLFGWLCGVGTRREVSFSVLVGDFRIVGKDIMSKELHNKSAIIEPKCTNGFHIQQNFPDKSDVKNMLTYLWMSHKKRY